MSARTTPRVYTIKDAAALTGLPASTLRYYETVGVIAPISRGESSKHRVGGTAMSLDSGTDGGHQLVDIRSDEVTYLKVPFTEGCTDPSGHGRFAHDEIRVAHV